MPHIAIAFAVAGALCARAACAQDPVLTDGDKYTVILENACVRVLDYHDRPGDKTHMHHHPAFVLYALNSFQRRLTHPDGKVMRREFKAGDVLWSDGQTHMGENTGTGPTHVLIVELKKSSTGNDACMGR